MNIFYKYILLVMLLSVILTGCKVNKTLSTSEITLIRENVSDYIISRGENATQTEIDAAIKLREGIKFATGADLKIATDWYADGDEDSIPAKEILVGQTNRQESIDSAAGLPESDFVIKVVGEKIIIVGGSAESTAAAVDYFLENYFGGHLASDIVTLSVSLNYKGKIIPKNTGSSRLEDKSYEYLTISFLTNEENQDEKYIYRNTAPANSIVRFCDGSTELVYKFDISDMTEPKIEMEICQNYIVDVSADDKIYSTVVDYSKTSKEPVRDMSNMTVIGLNPYEYKIFETLYIRIRDTDVSDGWGGAIKKLTLNYFKQVDSGKLNYIKDEEYRNMIDELSIDTPPIEVIPYRVHTDGGLIYTPLSNEAKKTGTLNKYDSSAKTTGTIRLDEVVLEYSLPSSVTAYDMIPVTYILKGDNKDSPIHIEATAFEDANRSKGQKLYDLALPGKVDLDIEYVGYVAGYNNAGNRPKLSADLNSDVPGVKYPQYDTSELRHSGVIESSDMTWFKFKYTNTGDTILDGDGTGTFMFEPVLEKKNEKGQYEVFSVPENLFYRIIDEVYPGEGGEVWITFTPYAGYKSQSTKLEVDEYRIQLKCVIRNETTNPENYGNKIWSGSPVITAAFPFTVENEAIDVVPEKITKKSTAAITRNRWLHTYEEFLTSFESWLKPSDEQNSVLYVQCAPWTEQIVIKLISGDKGGMEIAAIPVNVESDSIKIELNKDNSNYVIREDGTRYPAITAQSMADMRANVQLGPDSAGNVINTLLDMCKAGVNLVTTTAAFEFDSSHGTRIANNIDAFWFSADVMRELGIKMEGFITYPYESEGNIGKANWYTGENTQPSGVGSYNLAYANGIKSLYQYKRWGDLYWTGRENKVPLSLEDTRGWMRVDFNARMPMSTGSKYSFISFLKELYGNITTLNNKWNSIYNSFDDIDPEEGAIKEVHGYMEYKNKETKFAEWSNAAADLDIFRTIERAKDYTTVIDTLSSELPQARINLRTEGGNWMVNVPYDTDNQRYRHIYYSQRRIGILPDIMSKSGTLYAHSDYTTLPYTPSEVKELTQMSVAGGIIPMHMPQFNRMRDIAINERWGNDYRVDYNLSGKAVKGAYISTVISVYQWFKATYEGGGVPGILWQDYLCDGYATSTQRREMEFFVRKLDEMLSTPEGKEWINDVPNPEVIETSEVKYSYDKVEIKKLVEYYTAQFDSK